MAPPMKVPPLPLSTAVPATPAPDPKLPPETPLPVDAAIPETPLPEPPPAVPIMPVALVTPPVPVMPAPVPLPVTIRPILFVAAVATIVPPVLGMTIGSAIFAAGRLSLTTPIAASVAGLNTVLIG